MNHSAIEINCDVGELSRAIDDAILPLVTACNVCCGAHAGDIELIQGTIREAIRLGVNIGAHPSWPDRDNFGRVSLEISTDELRSSLSQQIEMVKEHVESCGGTLKHVKPHGALYHDVLHREELGELFIEVVLGFDSNLAVYGQAGSTFANQCAKHGLRFVHEAFGDRRYESATKLRSRNHSDALIESDTDFREHFQRLINGQVLDVHGRLSQIPVETICLHSDTPNAIAFARLAREIIGKQNA
ncbi:LamB/YcsF family protein [Mariniblastus fucicola]|uniref:LamB/YcsF family protein n=1 Tax=Mariniblastus fucicola TaxID=980251 RepID=A0A5B9PBJ9_9BACT|nr:LamB/YcsF family protein [Mariniblastus fucicola]QEG22585.1 LamB/YcsF family protein [Mariniblastus fucicola]